jgi:hypothetical protein
MKLFTIGFTQTSAAHFFGRLKAAGVKRLIDVRLNRTSQLAGFAKEGDLAFFAREVCGIETKAIPDLTPTPELLAAYRKGEIDWPGYAARFKRLIARREADALAERGQRMRHAPRVPRRRRRQHAEAIRRRAVDRELAEVIPRQIPPRLAVVGHEGIDIDQRRDPLRHQVRHPAHHHAGVRVPAEDHIVEILEGEQVGDVGDVRLKIGPRRSCEMHALAEAGQCGREDVMAERAELAGQRCQGPAATPAAGD